MRKINSFNSSLLYCNEEASLIRTCWLLDYQLRKWILIILEFLNELKILFYLRVDRIWILKIKSIFIFSAHWSLWSLPWFLICIYLSFHSYITQYSKCSRLARKLKPKLITIFSIIIMSAVSTIIIFVLCEKISDDC